MDNTLDRAEKSLREFGFGGTYWFPILSAVLSKIHKGDRLVAKVAAASSPEEASDTLAEAYFGALFCAGGYEVEYEPSGSKGPDFLAKGESSEFILEVTRFRPPADGLKKLSTVSGSREYDQDLEYADFERDRKKAWGKIEGKFAQVKSNTLEALIAIFCEDDWLDDFEVQDASLGFKDNPAIVPTRLLGILYRNKWTGSEPIHFFEIRDNAKKGAVIQRNLVQFGRMWNLAEWAKSQ